MTRTLTRARRTALAAVTGATLLAACVVGPTYREPARELPAAWAGEGAVSPGPSVDSAWWRRFDDPLLTSLVERALAANTDVRIAQARLRSARASTAVARAALWPELNASASGLRSVSDAAGTKSSYAAGFDASWEIDVFGGIRRGVEAARADEQSAAASLGATRVSVAAETARNYVEVRAYQMRLAIARANLASQSETLQLTEWRAQAGLVGTLDVEQAWTNREQTRAQIPALDNALAQSRHALATLLNEPPAALDQQLAAEDPSVPRAPDEVAVGIPADVLRQRPDVVAAERSLAAATARIGVAEASRYPSFSLSGLIGLESLTIGALTGGDAAVRSIAGRLAAPIFDGGRLRQQVEIQNAAQEQALAAYEAALLAALRDVENALAAIANGRERAAALAQAVQAARNAALLAQYRYRSGLTDFQTVLDTERTVRAIEDSVAVTDADNVTALIQLYKALGGGWTAWPEVAAATHETFR